MKLVIEWLDGKTYAVECDVWDYRDGVLKFGTYKDGFKKTDDHVPLVSVRRFSIEYPDRLT